MSLVSSLLNQAATAAGLSGISQNIQAIKTQIQAYGTKVNGQPTFPAQITNATLYAYYLALSKRQAQLTQQAIAQYYGITILAMELAENGLAAINQITVDNNVAKYYAAQATRTKKILSSSGEAASAVDNNVAKYYAAQATRTKKILSSSGMVSPDVTEAASAVDTPFPLQTLQPIIPVPDNVQNLYSVNTATGNQVEQLSEWKRNIQPFTGTTRANSLPFPTPGQLFQVADSSVADIGQYTEQIIPPNLTGKPAIIYKSWAPSSSYKTYTGTPSSPNSVAINNMIQSLPPGSYKFFIEKLHGRGTLPFNKGQVKRGLTAVDIPNRMVFPAYIEDMHEDFDSEWSDYDFIGRGEKFGMYKFTKRTLTISFIVISDYSSRILVNAAKDVASGLQANLIGPTTASSGFGSQGYNGVAAAGSFLPTSASALSNNNAGFEAPDPQTQLADLQQDNIDWGLGSYPLFNLSNVGRTGYVPVYTTGTPEQLYERATFLSQCNYAWYRKDGKMKEQPIVRFRIGDYWDLTGYISNMSFDYNDFEMDLNPSDIGNIPMGFKVTLTLNVMHSSEPSSEYRGFFHRADRDTNSNNSANEIGGQPTSLTKDSTLDSTNNKTPSGFQGMSENATTVNGMPHAVIQYQSQLSSTANALSTLKNVNLSPSSTSTTKFNLRSYVNKNNLLKVLKSAAQLNYVKKLLGLNAITNVAANTIQNISTAGAAIVPPLKTKNYSSTNSKNAIKPSTGLPSDTTSTFPKFKDTQV